MKLHFLPQAFQEFIDTVDFYDQQIPGLGSEFKKEFLEAIELIQIFPSGWQKVGRHTRKYILKKFPYIILYVAETQQIVITTIAHQHRHPNAYRRV